MWRISPRVYQLAFAAIVGLAAILRFWGLDAGLPHLLTRPDEEVVLFLTRVPAGGSFDLSHDVYQYSVYSSAYVFLSWAWAEGAHAVMQWVGAFPPGSYLATMDAAPWRILLLLRALSATAGVLSVVLVMVFTRKEMGRGPALVAGLILATSFLHVRESHAAKPDALMTLGVVVALGLMAPLARRAKLGRAAAVGVAIGLAMNMKYPAVLLLVPAWILAVAGSEARSWRRLVPLTAIVVGGVAALTFLASSPDLIFNPQTRARVLSIVALVFPSLVPKSAVNVAPPPTVPQGIVGFKHPESAWEGWRYYYTYALRWGAGRLALVAVPLSFVWAFWTRRPLALAAAVFAVASVLLLGVSLAVHSRYLTPMLPSVAIALGGALCDLGARMARSRRALLVSLATALVVAEPLHAAVAYDRLLGRTDTRVLATQWLAHHVPPGDKLAMVGTVFWGWGEPQVPPGIELVRVEPRPEELSRAGVDWIVAHDHVVFSSQVAPETLRRLASEFELVHEIDPFIGPRSEARYDPQDAYYVPMGGFGVVARPGPQIRIYHRRAEPVGAPTS